MRCLSILSDQNWLNDCWIHLCPRGAFTGTFPKASYHKPSQSSWRSHTRWTYGQSPIVCCAIYGWVACHLICLSETSMTPVWILNKMPFMSGRRLFLLNLFLSGIELFSVILVFFVKSSAHSNFQVMSQSQICQMRMHMSQSTRLKTTLSLWNKIQLL